MTVPVHRRASRAQLRPTDFSLIQRLIVAAGALCAASPAAAEVGAAVSIFSDARFRGYSLSNGHPAAFLDLSYDDPSGIYAAVSASAVASSSDGLEPLGLQLSGGYARQLSPESSVDVGFVHTNYPEYSTGGRSRSYSEFYAGVTRGSLTSRIYLSPHYFERGTRTLYGELEGHVPVDPKLRLTGHLGMLVPIRSRGDAVRSELDWRLGMVREWDRFTLQASWTGVSRRHDRPSYRKHGGNALIVGVSWVL